MLKMLHSLIKHLTKLPKNISGVDNIQNYSPSQVYVDYLVHDVNWTFDA